MKSGSGHSQDELTREMLVGLDRLPLPVDFRGLPRQRGARRSRLAVALIATTAAAAAVALTAGPLIRGDGSPAGAPPDRPTGSAPPTHKADANPAPTPTGTIAPEHLRLLWVYIQEQRMIVFENEDQKVDAVRVTDLAGRTVDSRLARSPEPGEPRTCGHPSAIRPRITVMRLAAEVVADFQAASERSAATELSKYRVEVRQADGMWNAVMPENLLRRDKLAGAPCYE